MIQNTINVTPYLFSECFYSANAHLCDPNCAFRVTNECEAMRNTRQAGRTHNFEVTYLKNLPEYFKITTQFIKIYVSKKKPTYFW